LGFLGSLIALKNPLRLLRAFLALGSKGNSVEIVFAGEGPEREALETFARDKGISSRVQFAGRVANPEKFLEGIDVLCSTSDTEQMPVSVLEAMSCGLPVLGTDVGDVREMVCDKNKKFICAPSDEASLVNNMHALTENQQLRFSLGEGNARKCREVYSEERMVANYDKMYREVITRWKQ